MRTTPPFDPRVQPAGMYVGGPPQMYMQPIMHGTASPPTNFNPIPQMPGHYASPEYIMHHGQHQMHPQYNDNQLKMARP